MSKRQFSELSSGENSPVVLNAITEILQHAEALLNAARILKDDIQSGKRYGPHDIQQLGSINTKIASTIEGFDAGTTNPPSKTVKLGNSAPGHIQIPNPAALTPWTPYDRVDSTRPPLPSINDAKLEQAVFTHSGVAREPNANYERLEWIGDAYLYLMSSAFIYQTFPRLPAGRCSQYRELLIRNKTLGSYTESYQLDTRLKSPPEFSGRNAMSSATKKQYAKVLGDVFEAYIAGIVLGDPEHGLSRASSWVKKLWRGELQDELGREFRERSGESASLPRKGHQEAGSKYQPADTTTAQAPESANPPKVQLAQLVGGKGILISYTDEGQPKKEKKTGLPWYTVGVYIDGWGLRQFKLGYGSALSKREAGAKAAQAALENKKVLNSVLQKKNNWKAAMDAQQSYLDGT